MNVNLLWIEQKYANQLQFKLERFKVKKPSPYVANFRCPLCGDSERVKSKTRGYLLENKGAIWFKCHNCNIGMSFGKFLNKISPALYDEYKLERLRELGTNYTQRFTNTQYLTATETTTVEVSATFTPRIKDLVKVSSLPSEHPVRVYVDGRKIPPEQQFRLYYIDRFKAWVNTLIPGKFENTKNDGPRLVMPMKNVLGKVIGFNARDLNPVSSLRYITIMLDEEHPKVFGLDQCDLNNDSFILEGPIDSLFVDNSLAMVGASVSDLAKFMDPERAVFVFDNEPRNKQILQTIRKTILAGHRVVIFPDHLEQKDINDMILAGMCKEELSVMLHNNIYKDAAAMLRFNQWRRA